MAKDMGPVEYIAIGLMLSGAVKPVDSEFFTDAIARSIASAINTGSREQVVKAMRHMLHLNTDDPVGLQVMKAVEANGHARRINVLLSRLGDALKIGDGKAATEAIQSLWGIVNEVQKKHGK